MKWCADMIIKGYWWDATGAYGTEFYSADDKHIGGIRGGTWGPDQVIEYIGGCGISWESRYVGNRSIRPGDKRYVIDSASGAPIAEIIYHDQGIYDIVRQGMRIRAQRIEEQYVYLKKEEPIAICRRIKQSKERIKVSEFEWAELCLTVALPDNLSDDWKLLILTFPRLQFGP